MTNETEKQRINRKDLDNFAEQKFPHLSDDELIRKAVAFEFTLK